MSGKNSNLHHAKNSKKDEFYTQLPDIERELRHYKHHFKGKVVYCNCDDPFESNFFRYFVLNFNRIGLKQLITTSYNPSPVANTQLELFGGRAPRSPSKGRPKATANQFIINDARDMDGDGAFSLKDIALQLKKNKHNEWTPLKGDGDFRSVECVALLQRADIVVTNPPFSLFREYVGQLVAYDKQFVIIGSQNAITYKEIFKLIKKNKIWMGYGNGDMAFQVPDYYGPRETRYWEDASGQKWRSLGNACWFTNLDISKRHENLILYKTYHPDKYPTYVNYEAIEVGKTKDIPMDYEGVMGVPITFLNKYNPAQFEIVGSSRTLGKPMSEIAERGTYMQGGPRFYLEKKDGTYRRMYDRLVIRRRG